MDCTNSCLDAVLSNYSVLGVALKQFNVETHDDYGRKAGGLLVMMDKFKAFLN